MQCKLFFNTRGEDYILEVKTMNNYAFCLCIDPEYSKQIIKKYNQNNYIMYVFWGNEILQREFWDSISCNSLLSKPKMIFIRATQKISKEDYLTIENRVLHNNSIFCLFSIEQETIPSHICESILYKTAEESGQIHKQKTITRKNIVQYIKEYCQEKGFSIEQQALKYICDLLPCTLSSIHNECNKYMLYSENNYIDINTVIETTSYHAEYTIWQFIDAIFNGEDIISLWHALLEQNSFFTISSMLQRELRIAGGLLSKESIPIQSFLKDQKSKRAKQLGYEGIAEIFLLLSGIEQKIKSGEITENQGLEYIICYIPYIVKSKVR